MKGILNSGILVVSLVIILGSCKAQKRTSDQLIAQEYAITQLGDKEVSESELTLKVNPENSVISGYAGCNNYSYSYKLKEGKLNLGYATATKIYCEDSMELENLFFQKMSSVTQFESSKQAIYFKNEDGKILVKAKKKD
ncbi:META domain-containing protein [Psychroflexus sediminis]|uniref:Heat shock protein HslJ n=1 Tax=Psychroflexus sediminis TaxID=470826 RepID=A0A1G7TYL0_9FLAO|nr:META domain-containing protein [Psychroflexus sediminis]SDG40258.1 Heat shock protein HslJ [Psychroflexus sediminis]